MLSAVNLSCLILPESFNRNRSDTGCDEEKMVIERLKEEQESIYRALLMQKVGHVKLGDNPPQENE